MKDPRGRSKTKKKLRRGRPPKLTMPKRIDATPEEVAEVVLQAKPKETWRFEEEYLRKHGTLPK